MQACRSEEVERRGAEDLIERKLSYGCISIMQSALEALGQEYNENDMHIVQGPHWSVCNDSVCRNQTVPLKRAERC